MPSARGRDDVPAPGAPDAGPQQQGSGHRERRKQALRQQLSDTATVMFLERGFDQVRVSDVARACAVSEKTVFNHFPTKESLLFDRVDAVADALRGAAGQPGRIVDAVVASIAEDLDRLGGRFAADGDSEQALHMIGRFASLLEATPSLRAELAARFERLTRLAADAMAGTGADATARTGADALARTGAAGPPAPETQIAATALIGLCRVELQALRRYADGTRTPAQVRQAVLDDVARAAAVVREVVRDRAGPGEGPGSTHPRGRGSDSDTGDA